MRTRTPLHRRRRHCQRNRGDVDDDDKLSSLGFDHAARTTWVPVPCFITLTLPVRHL